MKKKKNKKKSQNNIRKYTRTATALSDKAKDIMTYSLEGLIREVEPMIAAVYLSCPEEATRLLMTYPQVPEFRYIVSEVAYYRKDMGALQKLIGTGFFEYEVNWLLNRAKKDTIASARFVPIFTLLWNTQMSSNCLRSFAQTLSSTLSYRSRRMAT